MTKFRALKTFDCPELKSRYVEGQSYTIRPGNTALAVFVEDWLQEGKVELYPDSAVKSRLQAKGIVKWP